MNTTTAKWVANLSGVREVSLLGAANLDYWTEPLEQEGLRPLEKDGKAQVLIIAADARFMGLRFREMSMSIMVSTGKAGSNQQEVFLVYAFNSRRFFALSERMLFATPYYYGEVNVSTMATASVEVAEAGAAIFRVEMKNANTNTSQRMPSRCANDGWEGVVYLSSKRGQSVDKRRMFFARIQGHAKSYPFLQHEDSCLIRPISKHPVLEALVTSRFVPTEWIIREDAMHAKSRTYKRTDLIAF